MKTSKLLLPLVLAGLLAGAAGTASAQQAAYPSHPLSRAEVLADLHIWEQSGMDDQFRTQEGPDTNSDQYKHAEAEYQRLRSSPQFAALVQSIARQRGEHVDMASR